MVRTWFVLSGPKASADVILSHLKLSRRKIRLPAKEWKPDCHQTSHRQPLIQEEGRAKPAKGRGSGKTASCPQRLLPHSSFVVEPLVFSCAQSHPESRLYFQPPLELCGHASSSCPFPFAPSSLHNAAWKANKRPSSRTVITRTTSYVWQKTGRSLVPCHLLHEKNKNKPQFVWGTDVLGLLFTAKPDSYWYLGEIIPSQHINQVWE